MGSAEVVAYEERPGGRAEVGAKLQTRTSPSSEPETIMSSDNWRLVTAEERFDGTEFSTESPRQAADQLTSTMADQRTRASTGFTIPNLDRSVYGEQTDVISEGRLAERWARFSTCHVKRKPVSANRYPRPRPLRCGQIGYSSRWPFRRPRP